MGREQTAIFLRQANDQPENGNLATANTEKWEPESWPQQCRGIGFTEAPRGALGHWASIRDGKIDLYQCVVPTTGMPARAIRRDKLALTRRR